MSKKRRGLGLLLIGGLLAALAAARKVTLQRAAEVISNIPRGAMAIRRESLLDITVPGRPFRQTVFIAESTDAAEVIGGQTEDLSPRLPAPEHDPSETNVTGAATGLIPDDSTEIDADELYAEAEAVLAEAERIEEQAEADGTVDEDIAEEAALEDSMEADDSAVEIPEEEFVEEVEADEPAGDDDVLADETETDETEEDEEPPAPVQVNSLDGSCPEAFPIKVRFATGRYHEPGTPAYENVVADACYASIEAAEADGFSASPL